MAKVETKRDFNASSQQVDRGPMQIKSLEELEEGLIVSYLHHDGQHNTNITMGTLIVNGKPQRSRDGSLWLPVKKITETGYTKTKISLADAGIVPYKIGYNTVNWLERVKTIEG